MIILLPFYECQRVCSDGTLWPEAKGWQSKRSCRLARQTMAKGLRRRARNKKLLQLARQPKAHHRRLSPLLVSPGKKKKKVQEKR